MFLNGATLTSAHFLDARLQYMPKSRTGHFFIGSPRDWRLYALGLGAHHKPLDTKVLLCSRGFCVIINEHCEGTLVPRTTVRCSFSRPSQVFFLVASRLYVTSRLLWQWSQCMYTRCLVFDYIFKILFGLNIYIYC